MVQLTNGMSGSSRASSTPISAVIMASSLLEDAGSEPSNLRYGYAVPIGPVDYSVFA
jgi:hypothetical protein